MTDEQIQNESVFLAIDLEKNQRLTILAKPIWEIINSYNEKIKEKIANLTPEDMDDAVQPSFYDENPDHIQLVVEDVFKNWKNRSNDSKYNALLTTRVGGGKASTPMAMMYFNKFQRVNEENRAKGKQTLKVAVTFSQNSSNNDSMLVTNQGLYQAITAYNAEFGTKFGMDDVSGYTQDVISRLNKSASDSNFLDLVIVVDQLLTGFDAPELNTLLKYTQSALGNTICVSSLFIPNRSKAPFNCKRVFFNLITSSSLSLLCSFIVISF